MVQNSFNHNIVKSMNFLPCTVYTYSLKQLPNLIENQSCINSDNSCSSIHFFRIKCNKSPWLFKTESVWEPEEVTNNAMQCNVIFIFSLSLVSA